MNDLVEALNAGGTQLLAIGGPLFLQSTLLVSVLLLVDRLLQPRVSATVRYLMWLLVPVKLLLPPSFAFPTGVGYWFGANAATVEPAAAVINTRYPPVEYSAAFGPGSTPDAVLSAAGWAFLLWGATASVLLGWWLYRSWMVNRWIHSSLRPTPALKKSLDAILDPAGVRGDLEVRISTDGVGPAVCGFLRPVILIPSRLLNQLSNEQMRTVLWHELEHVRRKDVWVNQLQTVLQVVYWWHPMVWIANARIRQVREEAVDEAVVRAVDREAEVYPLALLAVAKSTVKRMALTLGLVGIMEGQSTLGRRLKRLLDGTAMLARPGFSGMLLIPVLALTLLPMAARSIDPGPYLDQGPANGQIGPREVNPFVAAEVEATLPAILLRMEVVTVKGNAIKRLKLPRNASSGDADVRTWILDQKQGAKLRQTVRGKGFDILSRPHVATSEGKQAILFVGQKLRDDVELGLRCDLTPWVAADGDIQVDIRARHSYAEGDSVKTQTLANSKVKLGSGEVAVFHSEKAKNEHGRAYVMIMTAEVN